MSAARHLIALHTLRCAIIEHTSTRARSHSASHQARSDYREHLLTDTRQELVQLALGLQWRRQYQHPLPAKLQTHILGLDQLTHSLLHLA